MDITTFAYFSLLQDGTTPLFMASQKGHVSVVDVLLRNGADPNLARTVSMEMFAIDIHPVFYACQWRRPEGCFGCSSTLRL